MKTLIAPLIALSLLSGEAEDGNTVTWAEQVSDAQYADDRAALTQARAASGG